MLRAQKSGHSFSFSQENLHKIKEIIKCYPEGRQASAVLALLDIAQRQSEGWLPDEAIEHVASYLNMPYIRVLEVATFYTMFNLKPVGQHFVQICTTTPCWLRGSDALLAVCREQLGVDVGQTTDDGDFTVVEVECLGACVNAPVVQVGDDFYEDLDAQAFAGLLSDLRHGKPLKPGSALGRQCSAPQGSTPLPSVERKNDISDGDGIAQQEAMRVPPSKVKRVKKTVKDSSL